MCPSKLLALFSALPITIVIAGPDEPQDELISQKTNLATEQPVRSIATFMRNIRRENPCFTTISTLAIAFVMGFLIMRCFIAISSSRKNEGLLISRRLASGDENLCSEGRTFFDKAKDTTWRKLLKPAAILGAGAIIGAAMSAGITAGIMKQEKNQLQLQLDQLQLQLDQLQLDQLQLGLPNGILPATLARLTSLLPQQLSATLNDGRFNFPVASVNNRLANCYLAIRSIEESFKRFKRPLEENELEVKLNDFAKTIIKKVLNAELRRAPAELTQTLEKLQKEYEKRIETMFNEEKRIEAADEAAIAELMKGLMDIEEDEKDEDIEEKDDYTRRRNIYAKNKTYQFRVAKMNRLVASYLLMLRQYNLDDIDATAELKLFARSLLTSMVEGALKVDPKGVQIDPKGVQRYKIDLYLGKAQIIQLKGQIIQLEGVQLEGVQLEGVQLEKALEDARNVIKELEKQYATRIDTMINNAHNLERRRRALEETKNIDPIILKTVKDIEMGTFTQTTGIGG